MKKPDEQQRNAERIPLTEPIDGTIDSAEARIVDLSLIGAKVEHFNRLAMNSTVSVQFKWKNQNIKLKGKVARTEMRSIRGKPGYMSGITFANSLEQCPPELRWVMGTFVEQIELDAELPAAPPPLIQQAAPPPMKEVPAPAKKEAAPPLKAAPPPPPLKKDAAPPPPPMKDVPPPLKKEAAPPPKAAPPPPTTPAPFLPTDDEVEEIDAAAEVPPYVLCIYGEDGGWEKTRTGDAKQPISGFTMLAPESDDEVDDFCRTYEMADPETQRMIRLSFELAIAHYRRK